MIPMMIVSQVSQSTDHSTDSHGMSDELPGMQNHSGPKTAHLPDCTNPRIDREGRWWGEMGNDNATNDRRQEGGEELE